MRTITYQQLVDVNACKEGVRYFKRIFGETLEIKCDMDEYFQAWLLGNQETRQWWGWLVDEGLIPAWSMTKWNLRYANLKYANLRYADLRYADLRNADLRYADLGYADLWNADLRYADLWNANLRYADLRNADLRNANHNQYTQWPEGFDMDRLAND